MKTCARSVFAGAIIYSLALLGLSPSAVAQSLDPVSGYANLGYSDIQAAKITNGAVTARIGARLWSYFGIEGEASLGVNDDRFLYSVPCPPDQPLCPPAIFQITSKLRDAEAIYAVGYLPITPNLDLFIRGGYGGAHYSAHSDPTNGFSEQSLNYGLGGDYFFFDSNGVRLDYTRFDRLEEYNSFAREALGNNANVWSAAYVLRF